MVSRSDSFWLKSSVNLCIKLLSKFRVCTTSGIHVLFSEPVARVVFVVLVEDSAKCSRSARSNQFA